MSWWKVVALVVGVTLLLGLFVCGGCMALYVFVLGSRPLVDFTIENQSGQNLTIYNEIDVVGNIGPGQEITSEVNHYGSGHMIVALNTEQEIVFAEDIMGEFLSHRGWDRKVVIPSSTPRRGANSIDLIIENKSPIVLDILLEEKLLGSAGPDESVTVNNLSNPYTLDGYNGTSYDDLQEYIKEAKYHIVANNVQGQLKFDKLLDLRKLEIIDIKTRRAVLEPDYMEVTFHNEAKTVVTVFVDSYEIGEIKPGEIVIMSVPIFDDIVQLRAIDPQGRTIWTSTQGNPLWDFRDEKWEETITPFRIE